MELLVVLLDILCFSWIFYTNETIFMQRKVLYAFNGVWPERKRQRILNRSLYWCSLIVYSSPWLSSSLSNIFSTSSSTSSTRAIHLWLFKSKAGSSRIRLKSLNFTRIVIILCNIESILLCIDYFTICKASIVEFSGIVISSSWPQSIIQELTLGEDMCYIIESYMNGINVA